MAALGVLACACGGSQTVGTRAATTTPATAQSVTTVTVVSGTTAGAGARTATSTAPSPGAPATEPATTTVSATGARGRATVVVLVRGAGFCTHLPTIPAPECDPRPLPDAAVAVRDTSGTTVERGTTGGDGTVTLAVPPGSYTVVANPVSGFAETARPVPVVTVAGETVRVTLTHNTGYQ